MEFLRSLYHDELNSEGDVNIVGSVFQRSRILSELEPATYKLSYDEWVGQRKQRMLERSEDILASHVNADRFAALKRAYQRGTVLPFVGAGMSMPSGYPDWTSYLWSVQADSHVAEDDIERLLSNEDYEGAAQTLYDDLGSNLFSEHLQARFGCDNEICGPIQWLPVLFPDSHVVTTNFDTVLERVFARSQQGFDRVVLGNSLPEAVRLVAEGGRVLIKMHGSCEATADRVLLASEYGRVYADEGAVRRFFSRFIFGRSLLFLGCRLTVDRTLRAMQDVVAEEGGANLPRHYALMELADGVDRVARTKELATSNIFPIWYPAGEHDESIEALLVALTEA
ncbi:MAG TPA: SIR2 family protein [Longimicrobium sp.]